MVKKRKGDHPDNECSKKKEGSNSSPCFTNKMELSSSSIGNPDFAKQVTDELLTQSSRVCENNPDSSKQITDELLTQSNEVIPPPHHDTSMQEDETHAGEQEDVNEDGNLQNHGDNKVEDASMLPDNVLATTPIDNNLEAEDESNAESLELAAITKWQRKLSVVGDRDNYLLDNILWTDCTFLVGLQEQKFEGHRLFLAKTSPSFAIMFFKRTFKKDDAIRLPDITPDAFSSLLKYVYCGQLKISSSYQAVCDLLLAAKMYKFPYTLLKQLRAHLWLNLYPDNVWTGLTFFTSNNETALQETAWQVIQNKTEELLKLDSMLEVPLDVMIQLLNTDSLVCSESNLFETCIRWGHCELERRNAESASYTLRDILSPLLQHIRFLTMSPQEFSAGPGQSGLLNNNEMSAVFMAICSNDFNKGLPASICGKTEVRSEPSLEAFHVYAHPDIQGSINKIELLKNSNIYEIFAHGGMLYNKGMAFIGVRLPTQLKLSNNSDELYTEDLEVLCLDKYTKDVLRSMTFSGQVPYNSTIDVTCDPLKFSKDMSIRVTVIFHSSGKYPTAKLKEKSGDFGGLSFVQEYHVPSFSFIQNICNLHFYNEDDELGFETLDLIVNSNDSSRPDPFYQQLLMEYPYLRGCKARLPDRELEMNVGSTEKSVNESLMSDVEASSDLENKYLLHLVKTRNIVKAKKRLVNHYYPSSNNESSMSDESLEED